MHGGGAENAGVENEGVECALAGKLRDKCTSRNNGITGIKVTLNATLRRSLLFITYFA